jgi:hypothetical protein
VRHILTSVQDRFFEERLIPQIYALYKEGKIDRKSIDEFLDASPEVQRSIFLCLSVEREVVPEELLEEHEREIALIGVRHKEDLDAGRKKLLTPRRRRRRKKRRKRYRQRGKSWRR